MSSVRIRPAVPDDTPTIIAFNLGLAEESERRQLDRGVLERGVRALLGDPSRGRYFLAECEDTPVGQIMLTQEWSDWRNGMFWWIQSVYVHPDWRARGVFKALFAHVDALSRRAEEVCGLRLYVERDNARAQEAYRRCGLATTDYILMELDRSGTSGRAS